MNKKNKTIYCAYLCVYVYMCVYIEENNTINIVRTKSVVGLSFFVYERRMNVNKNEHTSNTIRRN